jgi:predicted nucleic acid-binding protein
VLAYVDSSVLGRAYLPDERGSDEALALLDGEDRLVTGVLTRIEVTGLLVRAHRAGRGAGGLDEALAVLADDLGHLGRVTVVRAPDDEAVEAAALDIVRSEGIRALDAVHIAVAEAVLPLLSEPGEPLAFASRDADQAAAARARGLVVV